MKTTLPSTSRSLPIALLRARERVMGPIRAMLSDVGITEQQWRVLRVLQEAGPLEPTQIADKACLLLPSLTRILQKLEEKQYIERHRNKADKRKQSVSVTRAGADLIRANLPSAMVLSDKVRARMGVERYDQLLDLLNELNELDTSGDKDIS
ncbi:MAG: homoprotocatechuate degradation operon regulator HpaR [Rhodobacteraceae bacterium]|nr:homoprotocatechuate degradation operon regulator HpaR [Paracoccaceae bacterium]